jgi:chromosome segregation protein
MRLDRLEISGFKSFPDRADVAFDAGVTAIVGPNGCGKSNLVDAITWVLGEQSAKSLRGERMEDVIFSGSDARRATAAAEVRLQLSGVLTESARRAMLGLEGLETPPLAGRLDLLARQIELPAVETRHVEIARRLYRSGESEYLIDGEGCRLRDVQDLLMDAGLGIKAYAVIEQGKIGQILSAKPTERRQLIEEAAGITKYKSRRRAAELKLEAAQQNLTRIDDIVFEIEKQRIALKRQAAKARRYKRLREDLRQWEKVLFARRYRVLVQQIEAASARLAEARGREQEAAAELAALEEQSVAARTALGRADQRLREARERMHARQLENERREQQLDFNRQQVAQLSDADIRLGTEIASLEARREPARLEIEARREAATRADEERDLAATRLAEAEADAHETQQGLAALESAVDETRSRLYGSQNTIVTLQYAIERAQETRGRLADTVQRLDAEASDLRIELEQLRTTQETAQAGLGAAREGIEQTRVIRAGHETALATARANLHQRMDELRGRERDAAARAARLRSLEQLDAHREGYGDAARLVLASPSSPIAHQGSVADVLETDPEHERAVEALLGDLLLCVIVTRHEDAEAGLRFVRAQNAGRIGFLVTDRAPGAPPSMRAPSSELVPVRDLVRVGGPHREALLDAMRDCWVATAPEAALRLSHETGGLVATAEGDVYRAGRLVFGGVRTESRGILAIKREIKDLRAQMDEDHASVRAVAGEVTALEDTVSRTDGLLAALAAELLDHEKTAVALELQAERAQTEIGRIVRKQEQVTHERRQADEERRAQDAREDEARRNITSLEHDRQQWQEALSEKQRQLTAARETASLAMRAAADAKAAHATLVERSVAIAAEGARLEEAARDLADRLAQRIDERQRSIARRAELETAIAEGERQRVVDEDALVDLRRAVQAADDETHLRQQEAETREAAARIARAALEERRADLAQLEIARATTEADLHHLATSCLETLQAGLEDVAADVEALERDGLAAPDATGVFDDESEMEEGLEGGDRPVEPAMAPALEAHALTAEEAIAKLRAKIDRLGPVNMMAIEQFDELEARHAFLSTQRQDLIESIATAGEAIKRIDRTTRERFKEAFAAINRYFEETFMTLFGGGRAGLVLLDESDLLESGIDIIAQPPGKRLQNVQLLSGGEKALTAMALMFGIFKYRPSPFCLLDEIDAPLDDANIGRFIEMLRGMQDKTQFILVTHHRKTMEIADRLYGVTMEEPGVSKLISLKLN